MSVKYTIVAITTIQVPQLYAARFIVLYSDNNQSTYMLKIQH